MAGIQGLKAKEKKTYATTALENSEKEKLCKNRPTSYQNTLIKSV